MNRKEFAALDVGDEVISANGTPGKVTERTAQGVRVGWSGNTTVTFFFSHLSTAWMQWTRPGQPDRALDELEGRVAEGGKVVDDFKKHGL